MTRSAGNVFKHCLNFTEDYRLTESLVVEPEFVELVPLIQVFIGLLSLVSFQLPTQLRPLFAPNQI